MCHAQGEMWSCLHREDSIEEGARSIKEIITAWDRRLGDTAD